MGSKPGMLDGREIIIDLNDAISWSHPFNVRFR